LLTSVEFLRQFSVFHYRFVPMLRPKGLYQAFLGLEKIVTGKVRRSFTEGSEENRGARMDIKGSAVDVVRLKQDSSSLLCCLL
jgi:hypothetical protein